MDIEGLERLLTGLEAGAIGVVARDLTEPSPLALEVLSARPYAYLDDAPLEERRTQAVMSRRWLAPETAADLGRLDPEAIARVRAEAWPDAANADELHDALVWLGCLSAAEAEAAPGWTDWLAGARARAARDPAAGALGHALGRRRAPAAVPGALARRRARPPIAAPDQLPAPGRRTTRWSRSCAAGSRAWGRSPRRRSRRRWGWSRRRSRPRSRRSRSRASRCAAASRRGAGDRRMVRAPAARPHPPLHGQAPAGRDRAGRRARFPALPAGLAARHRRRPHAGAGCAGGRSSPSSRASRRRPAPGRPRSCRRGSPNTSRAGSTISAWPAGSPGRA